jgi:hypothetical protein
MNKIGYFILHLQHHYFQENFFARAPRRANRLFHDLQTARRLAAAEIGVVCDTGAMV